MSPISGQSGPHSGKIADKTKKEARLKRPSEYTKAFKRRDYKFQIGAIGIFTSEKRKNSLEDAFSASNRERERDKPSVFGRRLWGNEYLLGNLLFKTSRREKTLDCKIIDILIRWERRTQKIDLDSKLTWDALCCTPIKEFRPVVLFCSKHFVWPVLNLTSRQTWSQAWSPALQHMQLQQIQYWQMLQNWEKTFELQKLFSTSLWQNNLRIGLIYRINCCKISPSWIHEFRKQWSHIGYQIG